MSTHTSRTMTAALALALAVGLTACGSDDEAGDGATVGSTGAATTTTGIYNALPTQEMQDAGVRVSVFDNDYNGPRQQDADRMALAFMNGANDNTVTTGEVLQLTYNPRETRE